MDTPHKNLDAVFKEALTIFKDKTLDFLGLHDIAPLGEALSSETIEVKWNIQDLVFATQDGRGLHLEEQAKLSKKDLLRFAAYNINLNIAHKREFDTVIFVKAPTKLTKLETKQFCFKPIIVHCSKIDADMLLDKLKKDLAAGKEVNELSLIYLPLFRSAKLSITELFAESAKLINDVPESRVSTNKLHSLLITLVSKKVKKSKWEEVMMTMITESNPLFEAMWEIVGEERVEKRVEKRAEGIAINLLSKGYDLTDIAEATGLSEERIRELAPTQ